MFLVLHVRYHTYVSCYRNTELPQQKLTVQFVLRHPVYESINRDALID